MDTGRREKSRLVSPRPTLGVSSQPPDCQIANIFDHGGSPKTFVSNGTSPKPATAWWPNANTSPLSSTIGLNFSAPSTGQNHNWKAPDGKAIESRQNYLQNALSEATKRAAVAERKATEYSQAKDNMESQLHACQDAEAALTTANQQVTAENQNLKEKLQKLQKHSKNCEKATNKAQKDVLQAKGYANHLINSQAGNLRSAEQRYNAAARELKEWKEKYESVEKPAEENAALQKRLSEWQSKAEKARNEIAALRGGLQIRQSGADAEGNQGSCEAEGDQGGSEVGNIQSSGAATADLSSIIDAEAKAAKYKGERDALYRMLQGEVAKNAKLAESLVLRNAKLAESLEDWVADDEVSQDT